MGSSWRVGHILVGCPTTEQIPQAFAVCILPTAIWRTREVRLAICCSREEIFTSLTCLDGRSSLVPNCRELAAIFAIKFLAASGVLSTKAHPLAASIMLLSEGRRPSWKYWMSNCSLIWWWGQLAHNFLKRSQYSCRDSPLCCLTPKIYFRMLDALEAGKYFSKNNLFISFHVVILPDDR